MTIKSFHGTKLRLTKERQPFEGRTFDKLYLFCGRKKLCNINVGENFVHVFPKNGKLDDVYVRLV